VTLYPIPGRKPGRTRPNPPALKNFSFSIFAVSQSEDEQPAAKKTQAIPKKKLKGKGVRK
jgi:hypothetical protein